MKATFDVIIKNTYGNCVYYILKKNKSQVHPFLFSPSSRTWSPQVDSSSIGSLIVIVTIDCGSCVYSICTPMSSYACHTSVCRPRSLYHTQWSVHRTELPRYAQGGLSQLCKRKDTNGMGRGKEHSWIVKPPDQCVFP